MHLLNLLILHKHLRKSLLQRVFSQFPWTGELMGRDLVFLPTAHQASRQDGEAGWYPLTGTAQGEQGKACCTGCFLPRALILCLLIQTHVCLRLVALLFLAGGNICLLSSCFERQEEFLCFLNCSDFFFLAYEVSKIQWSGFITVFTS